jgi:hypothetical protein
MINTIEGSGHAWRDVMYDAGPTGVESVPLSPCDSAECFRPHPSNQLQRQAGTAPALPPIKRMRVAASQAFRASFHRL